MTATIAPSVVGLDPARIEIDVHPPLDWILVRLDPPIDRSEGGILAPAVARPPARTGVVIARGPGMLADDGVTVMPMHCEVGDRILFERQAGKGLPRVPRETDEKRWAYLLIRDGSVCAVVEPEPVSPGEQRALDQGAAGLPPRGVGLQPVSRRGALAWERLAPVQDWLIVRADMRPEVVDPPPPVGILRPSKKLHRVNGKPPLRIQEKDPEERYDLWSGTVLRRGTGLAVLQRWENSLRSGRAPALVQPGERCFFSGAPPWVQPIKDMNAYAPGEAFLIREYPCVAARIAG